MTEEKREEMLGDLEAMDAKFEMIGSYPELVAEAKLWDGDESKFADPVAMYLERVEAMQAEGLQEEQARRAAEEATGMFSWSLTGGRVKSAEMEDIKAAAEKNGTFMKAPNGKPSKLTERQWLQVRTAAFKGWFGDWERAADLTISGENGNFAAAKEFAKGLSGQALLNEDSGIIAYVNSEQRKELTHQSKARVSQGNGFSVNGHYAVVMRINKLFRYAVRCGVYPDLKHGDPNVRIHRFACPIVIDGESAIAWMTAKETVNQKDSGRLYNLELLEINRLAGKVGDLEEHNLLLPPAASKGILARVNELRKTYFENVSKVVDENGEPLVVYHGTEYPKQINIFKAGKNGYLGPGIYFTPEMRTALNYTGVYGGEGVVYKCFVNMRNPLVMSFADKPAKVILDIVSKGAYEKRIEQQYNESKLLRKGDISKLRRKGYDGVVWLPKYAYDANSFTAGEMLLFDSTQIKSATDNRGTFDGGNPDITFSVIGRNARTWGKYTDRAFVGRDDGMWRAEIDASKAKLKAWVGTAGDVYRRFFNGMSLPFHVEEALEVYSERKKILDKWYDILFDSDDSKAADAYGEEQGMDMAWYDEFNELEKVIKGYIKQALIAAGVSGEGKYGSLLRTGSRLMGAIIDSLVSGKVNEDVANELNLMSKGSMRTLQDVLEYEELYEAYPDLRWLPVYFEDLGMFTRGLLSRKGDYPDYISVNERLDEDEVRSTLLHEIQHAIQTLEVFAAGGSAEKARDILERDVKSYRIHLARLLSEQRWINAVDTAKDQLKRMIRVMKRPRAILKMGERFDVHEVSNVERMAEEAVEKMWEAYQLIAMQDAGDSDSYAPGEGYALPGHGQANHSLAAVEALLAKVEALPSRRSGKLRGRGKQLEAEIEKRYDENKAKLDMVGLSKGELYLRLAGEIEARNVQARRWMSLDERAAVPFNDTLEYPGEALVTFSVQRKRDLTLDGERVTQKQAWEHLAALEGKPLRNARSQFVAVVNKPQRKELTNINKAKMSADNGFSVDDHYAAVSRIETLFENAVYGGEYPDLKHGEPTVHIHRFACPMMIDGEKAIAWLTAKQTTNVEGSERLYNLELTDIEKLAVTLEYLANHRLDTALRPASGDIVAEVEEAFKTYFENEPEAGNNFSASLTGAAAAGRRVLEESGDEYVANRLQEAWQKNLEKWSVLHAGKSDANSAMRAVMEMEGLVKATYDVVQDDVKLGRLYMLQRWAMVYARMVESGEIPPKGALKGQAYEKFVERLTTEQRTERRRGMSREQAEALVKELGVARLESAMEKVARECLRAAEWHLKQKETARVKRLLEAAWPKREEGKRSPRGKLAAREYRRLEWIAKVMELSGEDKYLLMNNLKNEIEGLPTEMVGYEERKAELEDQLNWLHVFGGWAEMDVSQARKAARALEDLLLRGYTEWERKVQRERERTRRVANEISAHFKTAWYARKMEKQKNEAKANTNKLRQVKDVAHVAMSYAQMMLALRRKLGKVFCDRQRRTLAEAHRNLLTAQKDLQDWTQMELQKITGLTGAALEQWIASNNQLEKTGIMMRMVRTEKVEMTADEVKSLENMGAAEFDAWRAEELARMEDEGRYRVLPTWEEFLQLKDIRLLRKVRIRTKKIPELQALGKEKYEAWREKKLAEAKEDNQDETVLPTFEQLERLKLLREMGGSGISVSRTEEYMEELETTKEAMLYAVLLFEQPDYEHLVEAHGLTGEDVDAMKKIIGPKLLRWGYAMRRHLSENGQMMAAKYEAWNGVPFGMRENYFRGVFEHNDLKPEVDIKEGSGAATLGGSKYSILIPRRYHRSQIDWLQGASQVFMMTMNEQNNYIHTQHITREWRQLLSNREFAEGLKTEIGTSLLNKIKLHLDVIDAAPRADAAISASARKITRGIMRALAMSALSFNPGSLIKQVSCLLNAIPGGYVPDKVVKQSGVYQVLTYSGIGAGDLIKGYAHVFSGHGAVSMKELVASNVFQSRIQSKGKRVADILMMPRGQKASVGLGRTADVVGEYGLELMDITDRNLNVVPAAVVADAVYRKLAATDAGKEAGDKWCREQAIEAAGMMLDLVAQPKLRTQKGLWASHGGWGGGLGDFLFMFRSEVLAKMGTYFAQLFSGQIGRTFAGYTSFGALAFLVKFMLDFVTGRIDGDDLDDEDDWKKMARKSLAEIALNDLSSIPAVGSGFELLKSYIGGTRYYTRDPLANILPINEMISKSKRVYKVAADDGLWSFKTMRALSNWAKACGCSSGLFMGTGSTICNTAMSIILGAAVLGNAGRFVLDVAERVTEE
ncbi:MAG: hypothetical protein IJ498_06040 [Akkermansia sp.]|nr:hypothetical protein [Akkermansia sp.]